DTGSRQIIRTIESTLPAPNAIYAVAISPDDARIAACGKGGTIFLYDQQGKVAGRVESGKDRLLTDLQFSPDGKMLAGVDNKGRLTLWSFPAAAQIEDWPDLGIARNSALQWSQS